MVTRRSFLTGSALTAASAATLPQRRTKRLLSASNARYVGSWRLPFDADGRDTGWGRGLTLRRVGRDLVAYSLDVRNTVIEFGVPAPVASEPLTSPIAPVRSVWGQLGPMPLDGEGRGASAYGLLWDEPTQRLWWSYGDGYNTTSANDPSIAASTFTSNGIESVGAWRFTGTGCKATMGGLCAVPSAFANRNLGGRRLAAGFGGYFSIATIGPVSMGPSLAAFDPAAATSRSNGGDLAHTRVVGYPFTGAPGPNIDRCRRPATMQQEFDDWDSAGSRAWWSWTDQLWQSGVWIDTGRTHGLLLCPNLGDGRVWYETSTLHAERASHHWMVYDPADLAAVAAGRRQPWQIQPARQWKVTYPGLPATLAGWRDESPQMVIGVAQEPGTNRIHIAVRFGYPNGDRWGGTLVSVYDIR
jgi:hypothetical protein